jgi:MATE family, multidrug efflux pump
VFLDRESSSGKRETHGVKTLLGDPKKAIVKISIPMFVAMSIQTIYNLVDAIWVAGKGEAALSAVGFFFPFTMLLMSISTGLGIGGGAVISQAIGAKNTKRADSAAAHTLVIMLLLAVAMTIPLFFFAEPLYRLIGAASSIQDTLAYSRIMFAGILLIFFNQVGMALLRSEGNANKVMIGMIIGCVLNIGLDPIFIYRFDLPRSGAAAGSFSFGFGLGVAGAAYATVISIAVSAVLLFYWLFVQRKTYLAIHFRGFRFDAAITRRITAIGVPTMLMQMSMSLMMFGVTSIITRISGDSGVAVFSTGWRVVQVATLPILGIGAAVTAVAGAAYGAHALDKLSVAKNYALKIGVGLELVLGTVTFIFAPYITRVFTWSAETAHLIDDIATMLRYLCFGYPATAIGMLTSSFFQGVGKGLYSLIVTILRTLLIAIPVAAVLGIVFGLGMKGVYLGFLIAGWTASLIALTWSEAFIRQLRRAPSPSRSGVEEEAKANAYYG